MIKEEIKFQDSSVFEGMTSIRAIIAAYDTSFNNRRIKEIYYDKIALFRLRALSEF